MSKDLGNILPVANCFQTGEPHHSQGGFLAPTAVTTTRLTRRASACVDWVMSDAGGGRNDAGIRGLPYLDENGFAAATADAATCLMSDGDHLLAHSLISSVNHGARALGCKAGRSRAASAALMVGAPLPSGKLRPMQKERASPSRTCRAGPPAGGARRLDHHAAARGCRADRGHRITCRAIPWWCCDRVPDRPHCGPRQSN